MERTLFSSAEYLELTSEQRFLFSLREQIVEKSREEFNLKNECNIFYFEIKIDKATTKTVVYLGVESWDMENDFA